ncbi:MAG: hypothetical protein WCK37_01030 [Candidatus Falkowbacteria bacterium]
MPFGEYNIKQNNAGQSFMSERDLEKRTAPLVADILGYELDNGDEDEAIKAGKIRRWNKEKSRAYDMAAMKEQIRHKIKAEIDNEISASIKKYLFFDPSETIKKNIFKKALETVIIDAPMGYKFIDEITEIYLDDLGDELVAEALKSGHSFHEILISKLRNSNFANLGIDREKLDWYKEQWLDKYNAVMYKIDEQ